MTHGRKTPRWLAGARAGLLCLAGAAVLLGLGARLGPSGCGSRADMRVESPASAPAMPRAGAGAERAAPRADTQAPPATAMEAQPMTAAAGQPATASAAQPVIAIAPRPATALAALPATPDHQREVVLLEGKYDVPVVSAGRSLPPSPVTSAPGYSPPDDPESDAVERGFRLAGPNDTPLTKGAESAEWLARDLLHALSHNQREILLERRITFDEFAGILWPEMPQSRPVTNISAADAWFFHVRAAVAAMDAALAQWGGRLLTFTRLSFERGLVRYPNYNLYHGVNIHALGADGEEVVLSFASAFVEKDGVWKVFIYKD